MTKRWPDGEPAIEEGPSIGGGRSLRATFADGREVVILRPGGMNFSVRWRDAAPGNGIIHLKRRRARRPGAWPTIVTMWRWQPQIGWHSKPEITYLHTAEIFVDWREALRFALRALNEWISAPDKWTFMDAWYGRQGLDAGVEGIQRVRRMMGLPDVVANAEPDR